MKLLDYFGRSVILAIRNVIDGNEDLHPGELKVIDWERPNQNQLLIKLQNDNNAQQWFEDEIEGLVGDVLNNGTGAILLKRKPAHWALGQKKGSIVLCVIPHKCNFATWWMDDATLNTFNGNYDMSLEDALKDFQKRT